MARSVQDFARGGRDTGAVPGMRCMAERAGAFSSTREGAYRVAPTSRPLSDELLRTPFRRTSEKEDSPSVGIELLRRHGTGVVNRTVREHEDGPTPPPRSARPPRSGIVSGGPGPVHAPFGPFRPARERSGARKSPAAQEGGIRAAGPDDILLPGREGRRSSAASAKRTSQTPVEANFGEYPFHALR
jgi:hypothetical protein